METTLVDPVTLYHGNGTRSVRVRWVLEELGIPHKLEPVLFPAHTRQPGFLSVNPLGSLPAFVDGDLLMTESMAICEYLAARHGPTPLTVGPDEPGFGDYRQFCWLGEAGLTQSLGTIFRYSRLELSERQVPHVVDTARLAFSRRLESVTRALARSPYLAAGRFTLADVSVCYALGFAVFLGEEAGLSPESIAYRNRLAERPAYRRAYEHIPSDSLVDPAT